LNFRISSGPITKPITNAVSAAGSTVRTEMYFTSKRSGPQ
jgi:hypothetical protein